MTTRQREEKGRYAVLGIPVPLIIPDTLKYLTGALSAAQRASWETSGEVTVVKHHKGQGTAVVGSFENGEQVCDSGNG